MVNDRGILYTIEGVMAGILMITTAFLILSTTTIFTPGDTHINDMQLEQLGNDVLAVLDTPLRDGQKSPLEIYIETNDGNSFRTAFINLSETNSQNWKQNIKFNSVVYFHTINGTINYYPFSDSGSSTGNITGSEHMVKVTRRVLINDASNISVLGYPDKPDNRPQSVLVEVLMWRD